MKNHRVQLFAGSILLALLCSPLLNCQKRPNPGNHFCSLGSEEFNYLMDAWGELYRRRFPGREGPLHEGRGNLVGGRSLLDGECDLAPSTIPFSDARMDAFHKKYQAGPVAVPVALEITAIVLNRANPLQTLDLSVVRKIYSGDYERWGDLLPASDPELTALPLRRLGLNSASDRYQAFRSQLLQGGNFSDRVREIRDPRGLMEAVSASPGAIGYARPLELSGETKAANLRLADGRVVSPRPEDARSGAYPLVRFFYIYLPPASRKLPKEIIDFMRVVLSREGQRILSAQGLVPLSPTERAKSLALLPLPR